jgi:hypothetical protein
MKQIFTLLLCFQAFISHGQITEPAAGGNKRASVSEWIGVTRVQIDYNRPRVNGREGKIWGQLVHYGFADLHYGTSKSAPWRAGANENTTFTVSTDVMIDGKILPEGKYGFFIAMGKEKATLVFSKFNTAWGSFYYDAKDDALRVEVPVVSTDRSVEWLKYEFDEQTDTSAVISMQWEKVKVPFTVTVDLHQTQIEAFRREFNSGQFYRYWQNMHAAANYCLVNNVNLEEGLSWSERSINTFFGESNFQTLSTYSGLLKKHNRKREADSVMAAALPMAKPLQLLIYGISLNKMKQHREAFTIFEYGYKKFPKEDYSILGMMMGYYFLDNKKEAVKFGEKGKTTSKDPGFRGYFDSLVKDINAGKSVFVN